MNLRKFNKNIKKEFNNTFNDNFEVIEPKPITRRRFSFKIRFGLCVFCFLKIKNTQRQSTLIIRRKKHESNIKRRISKRIRSKRNCS